MRRNLPRHIAQTNSSARNYLQVDVQPLLPLVRLVNPQSHGGLVVAAIALSRDVVRAIPELRMCGKEGLEWMEALQRKHWLHTWPAIECMLSRSTLEGPHPSSLTLHNQPLPPHPARTRFIQLSTTISIPSLPCTCTFIPPSFTRMILHVTSRACAWNIVPVQSPPPSPAGFCACHIQCAYTVYRITHPPSPA